MTDRPEGVPAEGFYDRYKLARDRAGRTNAYVANGLGITPQAIAQWRTQTPKPERWAEIARLVNAPYEWLFHAKGELPSPGESLILSPTEPNEGEMTTDDPVDDILGALDLTEPNRRRVAQLARRLREMERDSNRPTRRGAHSQ